MVSLRKNEGVRSFRFPLDHFYTIFPSITPTMLQARDTSRGIKHVLKSKTLNLF